jgi:hypothetical protein
MGVLATPIHLIYKLHMTLKTLLIFAHYGEAQAFNDSPIPNTEILICGEGRTNALYKTTEHLARTKEKYFRAVNLGVVGSLNETMKIGEIFSIKTVYAENEFKSFRLDDDQAQIDLITAENRINQEETKKHLSHYAKLVDRELWSIAFACSKQNIKLYSLKLVSDFSDGTIACDDISQGAKSYSKQLYDYFLKNYLINNESRYSSKKEVNLEWENDFHFSFSQRKKLENLLERLSILGYENCLNKELIDKCKVYSPLPKERTNFLLKKLSHQLNPYMAKIEAKLVDLTGPLTEIGAKIHFSADYEEDYFTISMKIENEKNLQRLKESIDKINYKCIMDTLNGANDV